jgi:hypothetical protein
MHHQDWRSERRGVGEIVRGRCTCVHARSKSQKIGDSGFTYKIKVIRAIASSSGLYVLPLPLIELSTKWSINSCFDNFKNLSRSLGNKIATYRMPLIAQNPKPRGMFYHCFRFSHP